MLTPAFELRQDKEFLTVIIKAPFAKIAETEIFIEDDDFKFFSKPYFLRLSLPGNIVEDGREKADYNSDKGEFTIVVPKQTPGEHFEGLDMITKLLAPKGNQTTSNLIEILDSTETVQGKEVPEVDEEFDWYVEQVPYVEPQAVAEAPRYGFANQKSGVFQRLQEDMVCIVDCPDPDILSVAERRKQRLQAEWEKFDEDHYIADLYDDETVNTLMNYRPYWLDENGDTGEPGDCHVEFTEEEQEVMRKLPRKEYLLDQSEETSVFLGLVDILYAYAYNHRTTEGENHCESGWTICKISATLSWLEVFTSLDDVVRSCFRRCLCYPLYRHWKLCETVLNDVVRLLSAGRRRVLKVLLEIRSILMDQDCRYVLNDLYITDYCVWIQLASSKRLQSLSEAVSKLKIKKEDVEFNLPELENLAEEAMKDDKNSKDIDTLAHKLDQVTVDSDYNNDSETSESEGTTDTDDVVTDSDDVITDSETSTSDCELNTRDHRGNVVRNDDLMLIEDEILPCGDCVGNKQGSVSMDCRDVKVNENCVVAISDIVKTKCSSTNNLQDAGHKLDDKEENVRPEIQDENKTECQDTRFEENSNRLAASKVLIEDLGEI